jgi:hypothetical protein
MNFSSFPFMSNLKENSGSDRANDINSSEGSKPVNSDLEDLNGDDNPATDTNEIGEQALPDEFTGPDNVTSQERLDLLRSAEETPGDEEAMDKRAAALDSTDEEGDKLNEENLETDQWGEDMDIPELTSDETDFGPDQV